MHIAPLQGKNMFPVTLTVALTTFRKDPRFDIFIESLLKSAEKWPMILWEFLCVDGMLWYDSRRKEELAERVRGRIPYTHVTPKPSVWQGPNRLTSKDCWDACGARNTAFVYANGRQVIFVDDCMTVDEDFLAYHFEASVSNCVMAGGYCIEDTDKKNDHRLDLVKEPTPVAGGWLYGMNMSVPLMLAHHVNGYDELYSGQAGVEDCDFGVRSERGAGKQILFNPLCVVTEYSNTHGEVCGHARGPKTPPKSLKLRDEKMHYANEFLIQRLFDEPKRFLPLGNRFSLLEYRRLVQESKELPVPTWPARDWRDGQPLSEM